MPFHYPKFDVIPPAPRTPPTRAAQFIDDSEPVQPDSRLGEYAPLGETGDSRALRYISTDLIDPSNSETVLTWAQSERFSRVRAWTNWIHVHNPAGIGDYETVGYDDNLDPIPSRSHFDQLLEASNEGLGYLTDRMMAAFNWWRECGFATSVCLGSPPYVTDTTGALGWPEDISRPEFASHPYLRAALHPWLRAGCWAFLFDESSRHGIDSLTYHLNLLLAGGTVGPLSPFTGTWNSTWRRTMGAESVPYVSGAWWAGCWIADYWVLDAAVDDPARKQEGDADERPIYLVRTKYGGGTFAQNASFLYNLVAGYLADGKRVLTRLADFDDLGYDVDALATLGRTQVAPPEPTIDAYLYKWGVKSPSAKPGSDDDFQAQIDLDDTLLSRDVVFLYASQCGKFPFNGPQQANATWMTAHLSKLATHINTYVPSADYNGLIVIDYEYWDLLWDRTSLAFRTNYRIFSGNTGLGDGDAANKAGYEASARAFYEATFNRIKELRPSARVSFFGYPTKFYNAPAETAPGVIGYGNGEYLASDRNDTLAWLWEMEDFLSPNVYCLFQSVASPDPDLFQNTVAHDTEYVRSNTAESVRCANGSPVYMVISYVYQRGEGNILHGVYLNTANITSQLLGPDAAGADGVILWGSVDSEDDVATLQAYVDGTISGIIE